MFEKKLSRQKINLIFIQRNVNFLISRGLAFMQGLFNGSTLIYNDENFSMNFHFRCIRA